jgi:hypothetical protein
MEKPTLKEFLRRLLLGAVIWVIPFIGSFFVWDAKAGGPSVSAAWFYALMTFLGSISFSIAVYYFFKVKQPKICVIGTGFLWYIEALALDAIFLIGLFGMTWKDYNHLFMTYSMIPILMIMIANIKK